MTEEKSIKEKILERFEELKLVPREKDGKPVKWSNSPTLDAAQKVVFEELDKFTAQLKDLRDKYHESSKNPEFTENTKIVCVCMSAVHSRMIELIEGKQNVKQKTNTK